MKQIKQAAILGAGALGAFYASKFFEAGFFSTALIARGERNQRLKKHGVVVNDIAYSIPVINPDEAEQPADLIIVAVKHHHLSGALQDLQKFVSEETIILSVMNGLDSEEMIGEVYGMDKLLYAISIGMDAVREGNRVTLTKPGKIIFGEAENSTISPRVRMVQKAFDQAGIAHETPVDMIRMMWWKFMINVGVNQASAVTRCPYGIFQSPSEAQELMEALMLEVIGLAKLAKVNLTTQDLDNWYPVLNTLSPQGKTSMLQDMEAGRKTEVELFAGKVVRLGKQYGFPTPVNQTLLQIIHTLEEQVK